MSDRFFTVIGLSDCDKQSFGPEIIAAIEKGDLFSGGKRHHELVAHLLPENAEWVDISVPLENVYKRYARSRRIVVFASGDPLFYGFAVTLRRVFPDAEMILFPSFNSLQLLAHKMLLPYSEMVNVSLTGRPWKNLDSALIRNQRLIGVLTDRKKGPAQIASRLLEYGYSNYEIIVGECLGNKSESFGTFPLQDAAGRVFRMPNCLILRLLEPRKRFLGIPEDLFSHLEGRANMITKMPVRLLSLAMLDLYGKSTMWDIGFCTGSVSIEAKLNFADLDVIAFERREESRKLLAENCRRFGAPGIEGVISDFMECDLGRYPRPDAVFIGGHGGKLEEMVGRIFCYLRPGGSVVFNSVSDESCKAFASAVEKCGRRVAETHCLQLDAHNPITIMKAI